MDLPEVVLTDECNLRIRYIVQRTKMRKTSTIKQSAKIEIIIPLICERVYKMRKRCGLIDKLLTNRNSPYIIWLSNYLIFKIIWVQ